MTIVFTDVDIAEMQKLALDASLLLSALEDTRQRMLAVKDLPDDDSFVSDTIASIVEAGVSVDEAIKRVTFFASKKEKVASYE